MIILVTKDLYLRRFTEDDLSAITVLFTHQDVVRHTVAGAFTESRTREWLASMIRGYSARPYGIWAVVHRAEDRLVGYCGISEQEIAGIRELEIGYRLHPDYWNRGYATQAAVACRDYGFDTLGLQRLISIIRPENIASKRVAEKCGMVRESETVYCGKPVFIYGVSRGEAGS